MPTGTNIISVIKAAFQSFLRELRGVLNTELSTVEATDPALVNRVAAGTVVVIAIVLYVLPYQIPVLKTLANTLFKAASWLWNNGGSS